MDDEFGDDDSFAALPDDTLRRLEESAISSTQQSKTTTFGAQQPRIHTFGAAGLSRNKAGNKNAWRPPQPRKDQPQAPTAPPASAPAPPSSDYGFDEEDVIDLDEPSMVIQSTSALPNRARPGSSSRPPPARYTSKPPLDPETEAAFAAADAELGAHRPGQWVQAPHLQPSITASSNIDVSALQSRILALEAEQSRLLQSEQEARHVAQQKQGEIAIVRANHQKASKEYERRIAVMQKLHAEESARQKAELETGRKEREKLETDRAFLAHDVELEQQRKSVGASKARVSAHSNSNGSIGTPKKSKSMRAAVLGDGFEDDEVRMVSPSRSKDREKERDGSREQTPKVGNKRKRSAMQDSPLPALSFSGPPQPVREESAQTVASETEVYGSGSVREEDDKYEFMQKLLNHIPYEDHGRSVESLSKFFFPTDSARSLSSLLLDGFTSSRQLASSEPLQLKLAQVSLKLWSRCLQESYYSPIYLLLDLIRFALSLERASTVAQLIPQAVPLCIRTIELIASPTARASLYPVFAASAEYRRIQNEIAQHIDVDEVLDFLQQLCDAASLDPESCEKFWGCVEFTFMLLMLNKAQHISQITATLKMLATSALVTSFGPISLSREQEVELQTKQESQMIDRLTNLLFETPVAPTDEPAYTEEEIQELRVEILAVLKALCLTDHGSMLLTQHRSAIGRLIRFLDAQIYKLYNTRPSVGLSPPQQQQQQKERPERAEPKHAHDLVAQTINTTVRLLYHLIHPSSSPTDTPPLDLESKFRAVRGGYHKWLVSFTRLAFSDQLVLEAGIENEVVEAAHRVLDEVLSPEEGEAVMLAVETPRGTRSWVATEKGTESQESARGVGKMEEEPG